MNDPYGTEPLFPMEEPPRKPVAETDNGKVKWRKYHSAKRVACNDCVAEIIAGARTFAPYDAAYRRTEGSTELMLCRSHAQHRRDREAVL